MGRAHLIRKLPIIVGLMAVQALVFSGCAKQDSSTPNFDTSACHIADDQKGSFHQRDPQLPLQIVVDNNFSGEQEESIASAIQVWNDYALRTIGQPFFSLSRGAIPNAVESANPQDCKQNIGSQSMFYIVREQSMGRWQSLGMNRQIPAVTFRCSSDNQLVQQVVYAYTPIIASVQFQSVLIHELGHALGLDHSCADGAGRPDFRGCAGLSEDHPYHQAVMYPSLRISSSPSQLPEIKDSLRTNDEDRMACLYGHSS